jgi:hypothetical protein
MPARSGAWPWRCREQGLAALDNLGVPALYVRARVMTADEVVETNEARLDQASERSLDMRASSWIATSLLFVFA